MNGELVTIPPPRPVDPAAVFAAMDEDRARGFVDATRVDLYPGVKVAPRAPSALDRIADAGRGALTWASFGLSVGSWALLALLLHGCAPDTGDVTDTGFTDVAPEATDVARRRPARVKPSLLPGEPKTDEDPDYSRTGVPCGLGKGQCPEGQDCVYDQDAGGNQGDPYCVDERTREKTDDVPRKPWWWPFARGGR